VRYDDDTTEAPVNELVVRAMDRHKLKPIATQALNDVAAVS
jgi:hypothetical protein